MSYDFWLYRAAPGLPGMQDWEQEQREPLGDADALQARIAQRFPTLAWTRAATHRWCARGQDADHAPREVRISEEDGVVLTVVAYAGPRELRALMEAIGANYCYASEEMGLRDVDAFGDNWEQPA